MKALRFAGVLVLMTAAFAAHGAQAALNLCNRTSYILYAATGAKDAGSMVTQGWTRLAPGDCAAAALKNPPYYVYAQTSRSHSGPSHAWGGTTRLCVSHGNFSLRTPVLVPSCQAADSFTLPFSTVQPRKRGDWSVTFTEAPGYPSLDAAKRAGFQRLLNDNGYNAGPADGSTNKRADDALTAFRARMKLATGASDADVFIALERQAATIAAPEGYSICNHSSDAVWAAIALQQDKDWVSRGWWKIPGGNCATALSTPLAADHIYLLAERQGGKPLVGGKNKFCVTDIEFEIHGTGQCKQRGLAEAGFADTHTKGHTGYAAEIGNTGLIAPAPVKPARRNSQGASASHHP
ncbi:MAG TPA: DUF1036 domain-containing protein [Rhizomicrobium sp.]